jgi:hypothetical protein
LFSVIEGKPDCSARIGLQVDAVARASEGSVSPAMPIDPCGVHVRLHADIVTQADGMPSETPASLPAAPLIPLLEGEKNEWS